MQGEKGVSLIIAFFIMIIVLAIVLSLSSLLYSEIKIIRNIGNSVIAFYAADSGIEKVLFYDRKISPNMPEGKAPVSGLCSMCEFNNNPGACLEDPGAGSTDKSIYCNNCRAIPLDDTGDGTGIGCNNDVCNNCQVSFDTAFDNKKKYYITAKVFPSTDGKFSELEIRSKGVFGNVARQVDLNKRTTIAQDTIKIKSACVKPNSAPQRDPFEILVDVSSQISGVVISRVWAIIKDSEGNVVPGAEKLPLYLMEETLWRYIWKEGAPGFYYVDIIVEDSMNNKKTEVNIPPCDY